MGELNEQPQSNRVNTSGDPERSRRSLKQLITAGVCFVGLVLACRFGAMATEPNQEDSATPEANIPTLTAATQVAIATLTPLPTMTPDIRNDFKPFINPFNDNLGLPYELNGETYDSIADMHYYLPVRVFQLNEQEGKMEFIYYNRYIGEDNLIFTDTVSLHPSFKVYINEHDLKSPIEVDGIKYFAATQHPYGMYYDPITQYPGKVFISEVDIKSQSKDAETYADSVIEEYQNSYNPDITPESKATLKNLLTKNDGGEAYFTNDYFAAFSVDENLNRNEKEVISNDSLLRVIGINKYGDLLAYDFEKNMFVIIPSEIEKNPLEYVKLMESSK